MGRINEALESHDRAVLLDRRSPTAHIYRSNALYMLGKVGEATRAAERAVELDPNSAIARINLGGILASSRLEEAVRELARAVALAPDNAYAHLLMGDALDRLGRHGEALESLGRAMDLDSSGGEAREAAERIRRALHGRGEGAAPRAQAPGARPGQ